MPARKALRISHVGLRGVVGSGLTAAHVLDFASDRAILNVNSVPGKPP